MELAFDNTIYDPILMEMLWSCQIMLVSLVLKIRLEFTLSEFRPG